MKVAVLADDDRLRADPEALAESLSHWWVTQERARKPAHERALRAAQSEAQEPPPYRPKQMPRWLTEDGREELKVYAQAGQEGVVLADLLDLLKERHQAVAEQARAALGKKNIFGSPEYQELAKDPDMAHRYWLPLPPVSRPRSPSWTGWLSTITLVCTRRWATSAPCSTSNAGWRLSARTPHDNLG